MEPIESFRILLIEDDVLLLETTADILRYGDFEVDTATTGSDAIGLAARQQYDACICDLRLGDEDGLEVLDRIRAVSPHTQVIIATGYASVATAVEAMARGAFQYVAKPYNMRELNLLVERAARTGRDAYDKEMLTERLRRQAIEQSKAGNIITDGGLDPVLEEAQDLAGLAKPVLLYGETGTGKDLIAQFIHRSSKRHDQAFNVLNCASLTESLVDAELFGYEKGAFTGAGSARPGIIEASDRGTLFLDEIGDIPEIAQARLLRFLENGVVRRVGGNRERQLDVRIIAASHKDLADEVAAGRFREDLYHRLNVFQLDLPALRQRPADIPTLTYHFLEAMSPDTGYRVSPETLDLLRQQSWPGNVRELRNVIERAWLRARRRSGTSIEPRDLQFNESDQVDTPAPTQGFGLVSLDEAQRRHLENVLAMLDGNRKEAARVLGVSERHLYRLLKQTQIVPSTEHMRAMRSKEN